MSAMAESVENTLPAGPSASRRRDKPQLSCNFCRKRKLKCDRAHPCETCTRRGLSLSCTYIGSNMLERGDRVQMHPTITTGIPERIDQLERLVTSLITNAPKPTDQMSPDIQDSPQMEISHLSQCTTGDNIQPQDLSQQPDGFDLTGVAGTRSTYSEGAHWSAILAGIPELKDYSQNDYTTIEGHVSTEISSDFEGPSNLFGNYKYISKQEILSAIPARPVVDGFIAAYFYHRFIAPVVIHSSTFLNEYDRFWEQPMETSIIWVGMLYAVMCLSAAYQQHPAILGPDSMRLVLTYREKVIQCLALGKYAKGTPYTIETLLLYLQIEYIRNEENQIETWILLGVIVRLALRLGYNTDPSHKPHLSAFEGEMRRRAWALIIQFDTIASAQAGLSRMIKQSHFDTAEPRNLLDEDFGKGVTPLPPSRPDTVQTPVQYLLVENKLANIYGMISDLTTSIRSPTYIEIMHLDKILHDTNSSIPPDLRIRPMMKSLLDTPDTIIRRIHLAVLFHRANCILHHKFMLPGRNDTQYIHSRSTCIASAMQILEYQVMLDQATQSGGRLYHDKWKISSLIRSSFFLATTLLCLDIDYDSTTSSLPDSERASTYLDLKKQMVKSLCNSYPIWVKSSVSSQQAQKAAQVIDLVLSKVQNMSLARPANSERTVNNTPVLKGVSGKTQADSSNRMAGALPSLGTGAIALNGTLLYPTSLPMVFNINAHAVVDYSGIESEHLNLTRDSTRTLEMSPNPNRNT